MEPRPYPPPAAPPGDAADGYALAAERHAARGAQFRSWYDVLLRGKWIVLGTLVVTFALAAVRTLREPDRYRAESLVLVRKNEAGSMAAMLPTGGRMTTREDRSLGNEMLLLRNSLPLARRVAERLQTLRRVPGTNEPISALGGTTDDVAYRLQGGYLGVAPAGRDVDGITVSATSTVPGEAALVANLFAEAYVDRTQEESRASYRASREFLEEQLARQDTVLLAREGALRAYMTSQGAVDLDQESQSLVSQLAGLQAQRDEAQILLGMKRSEVASLRDELTAIQPRIAQRLASGLDAGVKVRQDRIADLEGRLEVIYLRNPNLRTAADAPAEILDLRRQADDLRGQVRDLSERLLSEAVAAGGVNPTEANSGIERVAELQRRLVGTTIEANGLAAKSGVLASRIGSYEGQLQAIPGQAIGLAQVQRERQAAERLYLALQEKLQEAQVAERSKLGYAERIRPALRPAAPVGPDRPRNLLLGLLAGLGLGVALAWVRVAFDHRLHRPEDLRLRGYTLLATIPDLEPAIKREFGGARRVTVGGHRLDTRLVTVLAPLGVASEAYRSARTALHFLRPDAPLRVILVTSPGPGDGKSTTVLNLAAAFAQDGRRVAVVDADLRRPSLHARLGVPREPGLVDVLFGKETVGTDRFTTPVDDVTLIPAGPPAPNPAELAGSNAMRALLDRLRETHDVVLVDSPPVLVATDAPLLAALCDGVVVVTSAGTTRDYALAQTMERLDAVHAPVAGVVLNRFEASQAYAYRYRYAEYRYDHRYTYGTGDGAGTPADVPVPSSTA